jgi:hypothetical protein
MRELSGGPITGNRLEMEVALDKFAELFAVFVAHVHKFDATAVRADIADHGGEIDLAEASPDFELDRVADAKFARGLEIGAAQADGLYASKTRRRALDLRAKR